MLKKIFITLSIVLVLGLCGLWAYLIIFGTPQIVKDVIGEDFTALPTLEDTPREILKNQEEEENLSPNINLSQVSTRSVAGYVSIGNESKHKLLYVELGTGHLYEIDLINNTESRVLATTYAKTTGAYFSPLGDGVVIETDTQSDRFRFIQMNNESGEVLNTSSIDDQAKNIKPLSSTTVSYTISDISGTKMYQKSHSGAPQVVWSTPLSQVNVLDSERSIVYPKANPNLTSRAYRIEGKNAQPLGGNYQGLWLSTMDGGLVYTYLDPETDTYRSLLEQSGEAIDLSSPVYPQKCTPMDYMRLWCAIDYGISGDPDYYYEWLLGSITANDSIWIINASQQDSYLAVIPESVLGYQLDMSDLSYNNDHNTLSFINKINNTLWVYQP